MRLAAEIFINIIPSGEDKYILRTSDRKSFWNAYFGESEYKSRPERSRSIEQIERRLISNFPEVLGRRLYHAIYSPYSDFGRYEQIPPGPVILVKGISYGSLKIATEIIMPAFAAAGFTIDDILELLIRYTPDALEECVREPAEVELEVKSTGKIIQSDQVPVSQPKETAPQASLAPDPSNRLNKFWIIANTSLVLPALVLLAASYLIFQNASEERSRMTATLVQERTDIALERQKIMDRYADQLKGFRDFLSDQAKRIGEFNEIETKTMQERLNQMKKSLDK